MEITSQPKNLHVALVDPVRKQIALERSVVFVASQQDITKVEGLHLPTQVVPERTSHERCANKLIQSELNIATSAFAGLGSIGSEYGYAVRPVLLTGVANTAPGYELHTLESLEQNEPLLTPEDYRFAVEALAHTVRRRY